MRIGWAASILVLGAASVLGAQSAKPNPPSGTVAGIAPAPAASKDDGRRGERDGHRRGQIEVLPDGRVFADFGHGYEQVVRTCGAVQSPGPVAAPATVSSSSTLQPRVAQPTIAQPPVGVTQPVPFTPPVPAQPTASQQMALPQATTSTAAAQSCWATDNRGQIFIARP